MRLILNCNPQQIIRSNTKKSWLGNILSLWGHTFSNVDFLRIKTVQSPDSVGKLLWLVLVFTGGDCAIQVGNTACFVLLCLPTCAGIRQSKCCGVLGCSCREMMRNKQPFLTAPTFFSNLLFYVSFVASSDYPWEPGERCLISFCIWLGLWVFLFLDVVWPSAKVQTVREIFVGSFRCYFITKWKQNLVAPNSII